MVVLVLGYALPQRTIKRPLKDPRRTLKGPSTDPQLTQKTSTDPNGHKEQLKGPKRPYNPIFVIFLLGMEVNLAGLGQKGTLTPSHSRPLHSQPPQTQTPK
jgi:hypothetical protein